ncbi:bifunctional phosphatase PAP2/diacylglycerol kinase family protein [Nocardia heshunensis]
MRHKFYRIGRFDRAVTAAVAKLPDTRTDRELIRLTRSADFSVLWLLLAAVLGTRKGTSRRAAVRGVASVAGTSLLVNAGLKTLIARRRPAAELLPVHRRLVPAPTSSSFPSGHSAAAAAFLTGVALESPRSALVLAPLAATVAYSRVHTGVHWGSDVLAGAAIGTGVAIATRRWWPVRTTDEAEARLVRDAPALIRGKGLLALVNPAAGNPGHDPTADIAAALPDATLVRCDPDVEVTEQLERALSDHAGPVLALGVAGGDGTVAAAAAVALHHDLPLVVIPCGTLNHFARDLGVYDLREVLDATGTGEAVAVDIAAVEYHDEQGLRTRQFINTASLGSYSDMVRQRNRWRPHRGRWLAFAAAAVTTLRRAEPIEIRMNGRRQRVWFLFIGNGAYQPLGAVPAFRDRLDTGLLDIRWLRADLRWSRTRAVIALLLTAVGHSKVYGERLATELTVELPIREPLAADGEIVGSAHTVRFHIAGRLTAYRRDESNDLWINRTRPHHRG